MVSSCLKKLVKGHEKPLGKSKKCAHELLGTIPFSPIAEYPHLYPDVILDIEFDDKQVHLIVEGYDPVTCNSDRKYTDRYRFWKAPIFRSRRSHRKRCMKPIALFL